MKNILLITIGVVAGLFVVLLTMLFLYPRPEDTTEARVFANDGAEVNYCDLAELTGDGLLAADIPKAFTPGCGWTRWPMPVLEQCTEPLADGAQDLRGLWRSTSPAGYDHIERIEQCGNRTVVTSSGIVHDFFTDGTVANGSRDIEPPSCMNTWVAVDWEDGVMKFHPFGLPFTIVTRERHADELIWYYPRLGEVRMEQICSVPTDHRIRQENDS